MTPQLLFFIALSLLVAIENAEASLRANVLKAMQSPSQPLEKKNAKCSKKQRKRSSPPSCGECGCTSCPCRISSDPARWPPADSTTCAALSPFVGNGGEDPLACALTDDTNNEDQCAALSTLGECQAAGENNGPSCQWFSFNGRKEGFCAYNPCANLNDGGCTLQQTGGRCVWYGSPKNLRSGEIPNPYRDAPGCYSSPCNNPWENPYSRSTANNETRTNTPYDCESVNEWAYSKQTRRWVKVDEQTAASPGFTSDFIEPYKCQWCFMNQPFGNKMGCQNAQMTSNARSAPLADKFKVQGKRPCGNSFCSFIQSKDRTFSTTARYNNIWGNGTYTWPQAYGNGKSDTLCVCPKGNALDPNNKAVCAGGWQPAAGAQQ